MILPLTSLDILRIRCILCMWRDKKRMRIDATNETGPDALAEKHQTFLKSREPPKPLTEINAKILLLGIWVPVRIGI
jgi:hypothetical protein